LQWRAITAWIAFSNSKFASRLLSDLSFLKY
jgi:hypothetical protein